jgi:hypothetical protein
MPPQSLEDGSYQVGINKDSLFDRVLHHPRERAPAIDVPDASQVRERVYVESLACKINQRFLVWM